MKKKVLTLWLWPFALYFGLAVLVTWPLPLHLSTHLPSGTDSLLHYWNGWWSGEALRMGQSPYETKLLFFPQGVSMVYHNFAWMHIVLWLGLRPFFGGIAAYNLTFLLNLALCGFAAHLLVRALIHDERVASIAGLIYLAWPHRLTHPSHPNMMSTWAIPLFLLFLERVVQRRRWQDGVGAGFMLALVGYTRWQLLIPAVLMGGIYWLLRLGKRPFSPQNSLWPQVRVLALGGFITAVLLAPPFWLLLAEMRQNPADTVLAGEDQTMQTDLLAYATPPGSHFLLGGLTQLRYEQFYADRGSRSSFSPYLGYSVLLLALLGLGVRPNGRSPLPWLGMAILLLLLALGPTLRLNGQQLTAVPMPYNLIDAIIPIRLLREPDRFNMFLALPTAVLAAFGLWRLWQRPAWRTLPALVAIGTLILLEYLTIPLALQPTAVSPFYAQLAADPAEFAILNIPVDPFQSKASMFAQTVHGHPILQGHVSRYPDKAFAYLEGQPWLSEMLKFNDALPPQTDISQQLAALAEDGIGYIVLHKTAVLAERVAQWKKYLLLNPAYEDETIVAWSTAPRFGENVALSVALAPDFGLVGVNQEPACLNPGDPLAVDLGWASQTARASSDAVLLLTDAGGHVQLTQDVVVPALAAGGLRWQYEQMVLPQTLAAGSYDLGLDGSHLRTVVVREAACPVGLPAGTTAVSAQFDDGIQLLGYRLAQEEAEATLTLYWQPLQHLAVDYKVFVHIFDPATGVPVAQDDAKPRRWRYPTTRWQPGEIIEDVIPISLSEVPGGTYGVAVGVYHSLTGERLLVADRAGLAQPDGRLLLAAEVVR